MADPRPEPAPSGDVPTVPRATYRLQLHKDFDFHAAAAVVPWLQQLGISHVYISPILQAKKGSMHGYDVVDHGRVADDLGGGDGFLTFSDTLRALGLGLVVDIVPNHMCIDDERNRWWWDVLENGAASRFAACFDVDWHPPEEKNRNVMLLPILGDHRSDVLARGDIKLLRDAGGFVFTVYERKVPVAPRSIGTLLHDAAHHLRGDDATLCFLADAWQRLPAPALRDEANRRRRHRDISALRELTKRLLDEDAAVATAVDAAVAAKNADASALDKFLDEQNHRLAHWRTAERELDYRRFFDVNELIGLRVEDPRVFDETHALLRSLLETGRVQGLRVDHVDGLADPRGYLERLRTIAPRAWIVVEKILARDDTLPADWPVAGTTGYDVLNDLTGVFVDPAGAAKLSALHQEMTGDARDFAAVAVAAKVDVLKGALSADVERAVQLLVDISGRERRYRDVTRHDLRKAVKAVVVACDVYRGYGVDDARVNAAVARGRAVDASVDARAFDLIDAVVRGVIVDDGGFVVRLHQLTGPCAAKGVEDTAFYAWSRFLPLNEVGGDPGAFFAGDVDGVARFHAQNAAARPLRMIATSTHDTKRSEDVRARLCVLSERAGWWSDTVRRFAKRNSDKKRAGAPDGDLELMLYQTVIGAWPLSRERCQAFMQKAAREAKTRTSWSHVDAAYEAAVAAFVDAAYDDAVFVNDVEEAVAAIDEAGRVVALAQTALKLTIPGVPDLYQGNERSRFDLVDPDNRRAIDFDDACAAFARVKDADADDVAADDAKLFLTARLLRLRRERPALFAPTSGYRPRFATGRHKDAVCAFDRGGGDLVVVVPCRSRVDDAAFDTGAGEFVDVISGAEISGVVAVRRLWAHFPVAVLARSGASLSASTAAHRSPTAT